jgi:hypothetical protein
MKNVYRLFYLIMVVAWFPPEAEAQVASCPPFTVAARINGSSSAIICSGGSFNLTATPNRKANRARYSWSGPDGFTSTMQNPTGVAATSSGTYRVTATWTLGVNEEPLACPRTLTATATVSVTIDYPSISAGASTNFVCGGGAVSLTAYQSYGSAIAWSTSGISGSFGSSTASPTTFTAGTTSGSGFIRLRMTSQLGCTASTSIPLTIDAPQARITLNTVSNPICTGQNISLTATNAGGTISSLAWSSTPPGTFESSTSTPTLYNVSIAGQTTVTLSITSGISSCTSSATATVFAEDPGFVQVTSNNDICRGGTLALSASMNNGETSQYAWSGPQSFSSTMRNPTRANMTNNMEGVYSVTATLLSEPCTGRTSTATVSIRVSGSNSANININTNPICQGSSTNLTATITRANASNSAGTGLSSAIWSASPNASFFTSTTANPATFNGTVAGTIPLTVTIRDDGGCSATATSSLTVSSEPSFSSLSANPSVVCLGGTVNFSATANYPATYTWSGPSFSSTIQNPVLNSVTLANSGTVNVTASITSGVCQGRTATSATVVSVSPTTATITPSQNTICNMSTKSLTLTASVAGSSVSTVGWAVSSGSLTSSTANPATFTPNGSGIVTVSVSIVTTASCTTSASTTISVQATPTLSATSNSTVCVGGTIQLSSSWSGGEMGTYSWGFGSSLQNPTIPNATQGSNFYAVSATVTSGLCSNFTTSNFTNVLVNSNTVSVSAPSTTICVAPNSVSLSAALTAGGNSAATAGSATFAWSSSGGSFTSTSVNPTGFSASTNGTYFITASVTNSVGCVGTGTVSISVQALPTLTASSTSPQCAGNTLNLSANLFTGVGANYSWSGPNAYSNTMQNPSISSTAPVNAGTYSVTATITATSDVCVNRTVTATTSVTIYPTAASITGDKTTICSSLSADSKNVTLTAAITNGGVNAVNWSASSGSFLATSLNPTIFAPVTGSSGTVTITASITTNDGCPTSATTTISVVAPPAIRVGTNGPNVCAGGTIFIRGRWSDDTPGSFAWSFSSSLQNPITIANVSASSGYSVSGTITTGLCSNHSATVSTFITIDNNTASISPTTAIAICTGSTVSLSGTVTQSGNSAGTGLASGSWTATGGAFTSSATLPNATAPSVSGTGNPVGFSASAAGGYSITATIRNNAGCSATATTSVTVQTRPTLTVTVNSSGTPSVCVGQAINFSGSLTGATYSWTGPSGSGFSSSIQTPSVSSGALANAGVYSVTATITAAGGCQGQTASATISVIMNAAPMAVASSNRPCVQNGRNILVLTATPNGASSYAWAGPGSFSSTSQNPFRTGMNATTNRSGVYSLTVTGTNSCSASSTVSVLATGTDPFPLPLPLVANANPVCVGSPLRITATGGATATQNPGTMYWSGPNNYTNILVGNATNITISNAQAANAGTYSVVFQPFNRCAVLSTITINVNSCARIASAEETDEAPIQLEASPNPTDGKVVVKIRLKEASPVVLKLADASGRPVSEWNLSETNTYHEREISLERNNAGVYILSAESNQHATAKKIIRVDK